MSALVIKEERIHPMMNGKLTHVSTQGLVMDSTEIRVPNKYT